MTNFRFATIFLKFPVNLAAVVQPYGWRRPDLSLSPGHPVTFMDNLMETIWRRFYIRESLPNILRYWMTTHLLRMQDSIGCQWSYRTSCMCLFISCTRARFSKWYWSSEKPFSHGCCYYHGSLRTSFECLSLLDFSSHFRSGRLRYACTPWQFNFTIWFQERPSVSIADQMKSLRLGTSFRSARMVFLLYNDGLFYANANVSSLSFTHWHAQLHRVQVWLPR